MTISNGAFIALLFSSLMILQAIVVSIYMRLKNRDPLENFLIHAQRDLFYYLSIPHPSFRKAFYSYRKQITETKA